MWAKVIIFCILFLSLLLFPISTKANIPSNLLVGIDNSHTFNVVHGPLKTQTAFSNSITNSGSSTYGISTGETFSILSETDLFLLPRIDYEFSNADLESLKNWFNQPKTNVLWVAGDFDGEELINPNFINTYSHQVLESIGSNLRFSSDSVVDSQNSDNDIDQLFVMPKINGGPLEMLTNNVSKVYMDSPTSILVLKNGQLANPLEEQLPEIAVILSTYPSATMVNYDNGTTMYDDYDMSQDEIPVMVIEKLDDNHWVILSGEAIFSNFHNMYDSETTSGNQHQGLNLVNNILQWVDYEKVSAVDDKDNFEINLGINVSILNGIVFVSTAVIAIGGGVLFYQYRLPKNKFFTTGVRKMLENLSNQVASRSSKGIYILFPGALKANNDVQTKYAKMFPEELYRYRFFLNPVRLAILKSLYEYPKMSTVELKTSLNLSWSLFNTHLEALKKKNYIHVDHLILEGNQKFIVSLQHHTLVEFENLILVLEAFLNSIPTNILDDLNHNLQ